MKDLSLLSRGCGQVVPTDLGGRMEVNFEPEDFYIWKSQPPLLRLSNSGRLLGGAEPAPPKTYSTRRGHLFLYSEDQIAMTAACQSGRGGGGRKRRVSEKARQEMEQQLNTLRDLTAAILAFNNKQVQMLKLRKRPSHPHLGLDEAGHCLGRSQHLQMNRYHRQREQATPLWIDPYSSAAEILLEPRPMELVLEPRSSVEMEVVLEPRPMELVLEPRFSVEMEVVLGPRPMELVLEPRSPEEMEAVLEAGATNRDCPVRQSCRGEVEERRWLERDCTLRLASVDSSWVSTKLSNSNYYGGYMSGGNLGPIVRLFQTEDKPKREPVLDNPFSSSLSPVYQDSATSPSAYLPFRNLPPPVGVIPPLPGRKGPGKQSSLALHHRLLQDGWEVGGGELRRGGVIRGLLPAELTEFQTGRSLGTLIMGPDGEILQLSLWDAADDTGDLSHIDDVTQERGAHQGSGTDHDSASIGQGQQDILVASQTDRKEIHRRSPQKKKARDQRITVGPTTSSPSLVIRGPEGQRPMAAGDHNQTGRGGAERQEAGNEDPIKGQEKSVNKEPEYQDVVPHRDQRRRKGKKAESQSLVATAADSVSGPAHKAKREKAKRKAQFVVGKPKQSQQREEEGRRTELSPPTSLPADSTHEETEEEEDFDEEDSVHLSSNQSALKDEDQCSSVQSARSLHSTDTYSSNEMSSRRSTLCEEAGPINSRGPSMTSRGHLSSCSAVMATDQLSLNPIKSEAGSNAGKQEEVAAVARNDQQRAAIAQRDALAQRAELRRLEVERKRREKEEEEKRLQEKEEREMRMKEELEEEKKQRSEDLRNHRREFQNNSYSNLQRAWLEQQLVFRRGLQTESEALQQTQDISRPWVYSYFTLLQMLGLKPDLTPEP
ncbi:uncharacterized protein KIAA2012 homolog [Aplochiton taeniatus]